MQPLKKYTSAYLKSFRYRHRSYNCYAHLFTYLSELGIHKNFNTKRGSKAGLRLKSNTYQYRINTIFHNVRRNRYQDQLEYRPPCLKNIQLASIRYNFPSFFVTNLRSISNKFEQLIVAMQVYAPDIVVLTETWINCHNSNAYEIDGFRSFHRIRNRSDKDHGGGVSMFIRNNLTIQQYLFSTDPNLEVITVICKPNYLPRQIPWIGFIVVYFPPNDNHQNEMINYILSEYDRLLAINNKACIFITGDINNLDIHMLLQLHNMKQMVKVPTRGSNCLDLCFSNFSDRFSVKILPAIANSDHKVLHISPIQQVLPSTNNIVITYRKKIASGYRTMANVLNTHSWHNWSQIESVQEMANIFYDFLMVLYELAFPLVTEIKKANTHPWMSNQIASLIKRRDSLLTHSDCDSTYLNVIGNKIKFEITKAKNIFCNSLYNKYKSSPSSFYSSIRKLTNPNSSQNNRFTSFPDSNASDSLINIRDYFENLLNQHPDCPPIYESSFIKMDKLPKMELFNVFQQLKKIPDNNSCSPGDIPAHVYRELAEFLSEPVLILFNKSIEKSYCPSQWKCGYLITIPKVPIVMSPNQLRPIIITSPLVKIIERHILSSIMEHCRNLLDPMQFGGLKNRSSCHYIALFLHRITMHLEERKSSVTSIFTDYNKAFDSVNHYTLIQKMLSLAINSNAVQWIYSFLYRRTTVLKNINNCNNLSFQSSSGVPQGSVLGGFLFILLVNDLMSNYPNRLKYIDDLSISIMDTNKSSMLSQQALDDIMSQSLKINLDLNIEKCCIMFHSFSRDVVCPVISLNSNYLKNVTSFKLLGVIVQSNLKWTSHVEFIISKANKKIHLLYLLRRLGANLNILLNTYTSFIRPILEYCAPVWHSALTGYQIRSLEQVQRRMVRIILGKGHTRYLDDLKFLDIPTLEVRRQHLHYKFACNFFKVFPDFMPKTRLQSTGINTRNANKLSLPPSKTTRAKKSPILSFVEAYNCPP